MLVRVSIEPLSWGNTFFGMNGAIVHSDWHAPVLTVDMLQLWLRVQTKIPATNTRELDALQQLGFSLVGSEVDLVLPAMCAYGDPGMQVAQTTDIPALRQLAGQVLVQSRFHALWYAADANARFCAQWIENMVLETFGHQCLVFRTLAGNIRGYASLHELDATEARAGLLVGRGAGAELTQAILYWAQARGKTTLRMATRMGNTAALRRHIYSGVNVESTAYWLYR